MKHWRLIGVCICLLLAAILVLQNTEEVETSLLFARVVMPRAVLLFATMVFGFIAGVLSMIWLERRKTKRTERAST